MAYRTDTKEEEEEGPAIGEQRGEGSERRARREQDMVGGGKEGKR